MERDDRFDPPSPLLRRYRIGDLAMLISRGLRG